ncbi:hypothetical protein [Diplocloster modestus]|uniref:Uncharacterized protein n=1 Tax=Diplocloster modestus TaxID=2850322 RepID=A0ABS6K9F4_9FIRM|nr:hypothetical protein [Diplocloster modestus]MBU9727132.1 hypothetical protein [Diplocloster modestus]
MDTKENILFFRNACTMELVLRELRNEIPYSRIHRDKKQQKSDNCWKKESDKPGFLLFMAGWGTASAILILFVFVMGIIASFAEENIGIAITKGIYTLEWLPIRLYAWVHQETIFLNNYLPILGITRIFLLYPLLMATLFWMILYLSGVCCYVWKTYGVTQLRIRSGETLLRKIYASGPMEPKYRNVQNVCQLYHWFQKHNGTKWREVLARFQNSKFQYSQEELDRAYQMLMDVWKETAGQSKLEGKDQISIQTDFYSLSVLQYLRKCKLIEN